MHWNRLLLFAGALVGATAAPAERMIGAGGECVPFARKMSGIAIYGDAWTWWGQAARTYERGTNPRIGAVLAFKPHGAMTLGHVAVVSQLVAPGVIMVTHANWSRIGGVRGQAERDVTVVDASGRGDWSVVRVWYDGEAGLGATRYPVHGFIYPQAGRQAPRVERTAMPSPELSGSSPDFIGALIDATR
jgi:surface antigen